ncbi:MAG: TIM barrel protein [Oscillospiraceae bacterium]|nr:TIM barrel protein [Oscillospiraceae bacterium]
MLKFGPAGCDEGYAGKVVDIPAYLAENGLDAFEVQCGHGVRMGESAARTLRANAERHGITLSVHAPYFISLTNPERLDGNLQYLRQTAALAGWLGAERVVVHTGAVMGLPRREAQSRAAKTVEAVLEAARAEGWPDAVFCLETMGKVNQLGTVEEVLELCGTDGRLLPCIDFGHLYARSAGTFDDFASVLDAAEEALGVERARGCHIHFSKIAYTKSGESKHLTFDDEGGPEWAPLARLLAERGYQSTVVCESRGTQTRDAAAMKKIYMEGKT